MTNTGYATQQTTNAGTLILTVMAILLALSLSLLAATKPASASIFYTLYTVNESGDAPDAAPGNALCDTTPNVLGEQCTLRAAIQESNATAGTQVIYFDMPRKGVHTISPKTELPEITDSVTINGYSQHGSAPNTLAKGTNAKLMIELDGSQTGAPAYGLQVMGPDVVVKGLVINGFDYSGIYIGSDAANTKIAGNFIGPEPSGTKAPGNSWPGVSVNDSSGITNNTVGGLYPADRNLISGNGDHGIQLYSGGNKVYGNLIGTQRDGKSPLGNLYDGVTMSLCANNKVGGPAPGYANTIAFNGSRGVDISISNAKSASILSNSIFSNGSLGIDLGNDLVTPNDPGDADSGPNGLQNYPVLSSAKKSATGKTVIKGKLNSTPNQTFNVQFFKNPKGTDEGKKLLFSKPVTTDGTGTVSFAFATKKKVKVGQNVTATATNFATKDTSEFSAPRKVVKS